MPIPDFQSAMLPLLRVVGDGKEHSMPGVVDTLAAEFKLTEAEREEMLPSRRARKFYNRLAWAKMYLQRAGLLSSPRRGRFQISPRGLEVLKNAPPRIDIKYLGQYSEFVLFRTTEEQPATATAETASEQEAVETDTPEEALESAYQKIRASVAAELIERVKAASPAFFERLVVDLLVKMGYGGSRKDAGRAIGKSGDEGIDGIINEDRLGLDVIYIQAKRWDGSVGRPEVQKFVGALHGKRARKGVFITTGSFTSDARGYAGVIETNVVLVDGQRLAELMIDHEVGVSTVAPYTLKRVDSDYFDDSTAV